MFVFAFMFMYTFMFMDSPDKTNCDNEYKKHKNESYPEWRKNPQP